MGQCDRPGVLAAGLGGLGYGTARVDAATLWGNSLAVPALAARVRREYRADLGSRSGLLSQLFFCAEIIAAGDRYAGPLAEPAQREATRLISSLR
ncbi:MAG: hypothetical protein ACRDRA_14905 [Pseudonocardiaceae bacterium]